MPEKGACIMEYTTGNWTVKSLTKDSIEQSKTPSVPDLSYAVDYSKTLDEPDEARVANVTGSDVVSPEYIRYAKSTVANVYTNTDCEAAAQAPIKNGVQVMSELHTKYRAINSVTGEEIDVPCVGRIVLRVPTFSAVTEDLVSDLLARTVAAAYNTGSSDASRIMEMARGSLLPN